MIAREPVEHAAHHDVRRVRAALRGDAVRKEHAVVGQREPQHLRAIAREVRARRRDELRARRERAVGEQQLAIVDVPPNTRLAVGARQERRPQVRRERADRAERGRQRGGDRLPRGGSRVRALGGERGVERDVAAILVDRLERRDARRPRQVRLGRGDDARNEPQPRGDRTQANVGIAVVTSEQRVHRLADYARVGRRVAVQRRDRRVLEELEIDRVEQRRRVGARAERRGRAERTREPRAPRPQRRHPLRLPGYREIGEPVVVAMHAELIREERIGPHRRGDVRVVERDDRSRRRRRSPRRERRRRAEGAAREQARDATAR